MNNFMPNNPYFCFLTYPTEKYNVPMVKLRDHLRQLLRASG